MANSSESTELEEVKKSLQRLSSSWAEDDVAKEVLSQSKIPSPEFKVSLSSVLIGEKINLSFLCYQQLKNTLPQLPMNANNIRSNTHC
jgi:hypothetical protein